LVQVWVGGLTLADHPRHVVELVYRKYASGRIVARRRHRSKRKTTCRGSGKGLL
jgi:hypothetical protein